MKNLRSINQPILVRRIAWIIVCLFTMSVAWTHCGPLTCAEDNVPIAEQAKAVFTKRCVSCHSQSQARGGLDMTTLEGIRAGSNSGAVVEPGKPQESLVYTLAAHQDTPKMPPNAA